jgi:hypothetical protein
MKAVRAFGDSFLYGSDLNDCPPDSLEKPSQSTWPALIAQDLELEYRCYARPGVGNSWIAQQVLTYAREDSLNVINWTWIDRWDYFNIVNKQWQTARPTGTEHDAHANLWYKYFQSELMDKWQDLTIIHSTINYLKQHNIPCVFHAMDELLLDPVHHAPPYVVNLQNDIRDELLRFPLYTTFLTWSQLEKFEISKNLHPLEDAHKAAADYWLKSYFSKKDE